MGNNFSQHQVHYSKEVLISQTGFVDDCFVTGQEYNTSGLNCNRPTEGSDEKNHYASKCGYSEFSSMEAACERIKNEKVLSIHGWKSLPAPMKSPQGTFVGNTLFISTGYTASSSISAFDYSSNSWMSLPPLSKDLKSPAMTCMGNKLILLGGKEDQRKRSPIWGLTNTNRVQVWDLEKKSWESSLPCMLAPRVSPVVVRHSSYIIVAGGSPGNLDYRAELLDTSASPMHWMYSPSLPLPCRQNTSAVVGNTWYMLDTSNGIIYYIDLEVYIKQTLLLKGDIPSVTTSTGKLGWHQLAHKSSSTVPFKIASLGSQLAAFTEVNGKISMYLLQDDDSWSHVRGQAIPLTLSSALLLEKDNCLWLLGGEHSAGYSDKTYTISLVTQDSLKEVKKRKSVKIC